MSRAETMRRDGARRMRALPERLAVAVVATLLGVLGASSIAQAAVATPAWELQVVHGPTNVPIVPTVAEVQKITVRGVGGGAPNGGKFRLGFESPEGKEGHSKFLPYNAEAKQVQEALEAIKPIGLGNVSVSGGPKAAGESEWSYDVTFTGALAGEELEELEVEEELTETEQKRIEKAGESPEAAEVEASLVRNGLHDTVIYQLIPINVGGAATSGKITVTDTLPAGLTTRTTPAGANSNAPASPWTCKPVGKGQPKVTCTTEGVVQPDSEALPLVIEAYVDPAALSEGEPLEDHASLAGGGATTVVQKTDVATVGNTPAAFGIAAGTFIASSYGPAGEKSTQAGAHPYSAVTSFFFNTVDRFNSPEQNSLQGAEVVVPGNVKDVSVTLPPGFIGNPQAVERCTQEDFTQGTKGGPHPNLTCHPDAQVGLATVYYSTPEEAPVYVPLYNLVPPPGAPAEFGFIFKNVPIRLDAHLVREPAGAPGEASEYRISVMSPDINEAFNIHGIAIALWGVPADTTHDSLRFEKKEGEKTKEELETGAKYSFKEGETARPFLTNPVDCLRAAEEAPFTSMVYDPWERPGTEGTLNPLPGGNWLTEQASAPPVTGCDALRFEPTIGFQPETTQVGASSGYTFHLHIPANEDPASLAVPELKDTTVTLPPGVSLSASAANGLVACSEAELEVDSTERGHCPDASQVGSVTITSQLLDAPLTGRLYVGEPLCSPCSPADAEGGRLLRLFIEAEGSGVRVKLPGTGSINQATGQLSTTFLNNPQTPFTDLVLTLKGKEQASLANPPTCGTFQSLASLTPWSLGGLTSGGEQITGDPIANATAGFSTTWDGVGGACPGTLPFAPTFSAGTESSAAGQFSPFDVVFKRNDGREQDFTGTTVQTPPGLLGKIAGIPLCGEAEAAAGSCPSASRIATATSAAGAGRPYYVSGPVYLTGPYNGGPFGLAIVVPAKAGPFDLGTVVVRASIRIDPKTSAITIVSDELPQSRDGIPFLLKEIDVRVDHPEFMLNATNCERQEISATMSGSQGGVVTQRAPYTPTGCAGLPFAPRLTASTLANASKRNGASLAVRLEQKPGEAHVRKVELQLPLALPSRLETLQKACTQTQFAADPKGCPEASVVGEAVANTPLLSSPLKGPAYLVSHGGAAFPDLVFLLEGEGVKVELVGNTDIKKGITYSRFETVPDAPISSFEAIFPEGPHSVLGAFGNLCEGDLLAPTKIVGQNGAQLLQTTKIAVEGCGPTVAIARTSVRKGYLLVTVRLSEPGTVKISGTGLRTTTKRNLAAGTRTIAVRLTAAGRVAKAKHRKLRIRATVTVAGGQSATKTARVKA